MLGSMGGIEALSVADLFCGSGAMGAEALSRGASHVTFVDHDQAALAAVRANLAAAGLVQPPTGGPEAARSSPAPGHAGRRATLVRAELPGWLDRSPAFDLVLCDPPYRFSAWEALLESLRCDVGVLESSTPVPVPSGWRVTRSRRYGGTLVTVVRRTDLHDGGPPFVGAGTSDVPASALPASPSAPSAPPAPPTPPTTRS